MHAERWTSRLDPDEQLLWQGRPDTRLRLIWREWLFLLAGSFCLFAGGLLLWWWASWRHGLGGLLFAAAGVGLTLGPAWLDRRRRSRLDYAITNRRALIATDDVVESWERSAAMPLRLWRGGVLLGTRKQPGRWGTSDVPAGFEALGRGAREVLAVLQQPGDVPRAAHPVVSPSGIPRAMDPGAPPPR